MENSLRGVWFLFVLLPCLDPVGKLDSLEMWSAVCRLSATTSVFLTDIVSAICRRVYAGSR
jgi:hypothetical protein